MDPRQQHADAVELAVATVGEFQTLIRVAKLKGDEAVVNIARAVGSSSQESAANALNGTADTRDRLAELLGNLEVVAQEMRRYGGGF